MEATEVLHKKKLLAPKLRFKGFDDTWKSCTLNDVTQYTKGFAFKSDDYKDEGTRIIRVSDLGADRIKVDNEKIFIDTENANLYEKYKLMAENIIITTVGSKPDLLESAVGRGIFVKKDGEGLLNQNLLKFENIKGVDNGFIMGLINSKKYQLHVKAIARGNANQANITVVDLLQYKLAIPTFPEQQKIASFLSAVDEKIQQLTRKKELLEQYKKGVTQQLFSGGLKLKDDEGGWEKVSIQKLIDTKAILSHLDGNHGGLYPRNEEFSSTGVPYISANDFIDGKVKFTSCKFLPVERAAKFKKGLAKDGDVLFAHNATVGPTAILKTEFAYVILSTTATYFRCDNKQLLNVYLKVFFESKDFIEQYSRVMSQSTRNQVPITMQRKFKIKLPPPAVQKKIAEYFESINNKIEIVNNQITQTQTFKKGLLQQMFV